MAGKRCLLIGASLVVFCWQGCAGTQALKRRTGPEYKAETHSWIQATQRLGANGMWLITRGYHAGDDVVAVSTNSALSHAAILDLDRHAVIEAIGGGVVVTGLTKFLREAHRVVLVRPKGWNVTKGAKAVTKARSQVGKGYDFLGIVGMPDKNRWYCSELAAWSIGLQVNQLGPVHVLHPRNMSKLGEVLFDSGQRDAVPDAAQVTGTVAALGW